jgi:spermidine/putrescine transport system ATP-binding protein
MEETGSTIRLEGISKHYGSVTAVEDISLDVRKGEFLTLLGPSGSGKTTLLRLIAGLEQPDRGRVFIAGRDMTSEPPYRRPVHTVFQNYVLFPHLNVFKNIAFGLEQKRLSRREIERKVKEILDLVHLSGYEHRMPQELSGGEQQRVAVARALVLEPEAVLLDEPLAALDLTLRQEMQSELKRLQRELKISFLLVTHDQQEAMAMSDRIAVIARGRIEQVGTPQEVYERPASAFVANFIGLSNIFDADLEWLDDRCARVTVLGRSIALALDGAVIRTPRVRLVIRPEHLHLRAEAKPASSLLQFQGVIADVLYLGGSTRWRVRVGDMLVTVSEPNRPGVSAERFRVGQTVALCCAPESIVVLPPERRGADEIVASG